MAKKSKLAGLAKNKTKSAKSKTSTSTSTNKTKTDNVNKSKEVKSNENEQKKEVDPKELEIQDKVSKLIEHVDLIKTNVSKGEETKEETNTSRDPQQNVESTNTKIVDKKDSAIIWYEEQLNEMYAKYDQLKKEKDEIVDSFGKNYSSVDSSDEKKVKDGIIVLFNEVQGHYIKLGKNLVIHPKQFLERLVHFFPFLEAHRKF